MSKVVRIYRRLGLTIQDVPFVTPKPKGMHQKTYNRLIERAQGLAYESPETVTRKLDKHAKSTLIGPSSSLIDVYYDIGKSPNPAPQVPMTIKPVKEDPPGSKR